MKKVVILSAILASVTSLNGCVGELDFQRVSNEPENTVDVTINADVLESEEIDSATKTIVSGSSIKWSSTGEKIKVYEVATNGGETSIASVNSNVGTSSDSYVTMSFNLSLAAKTADNFTYYANYPSTAWVSNNSTLAQANIETKKFQTPTASSFDPSADLLISKGIDNGTVQPTKLDMEFARAVAIGKMTITNLPVAETVNKVIISANNGSDVILTGRTTFDLTTAEPVSEYGDMIANKAVEISTASLGLSASSSMDVWFTCYPFELSTGNTFTVEVETDTYTCSRTVTIPAARELNFVAGKVSRFSVDMTSASTEKAQVWSKYSGAITAGEYLIVSAGQAMKAEVSSNRFAYTSVTAVNDEVFTNKTDIIWVAAASSTYWTLYNAYTDKYAASTGGASKAQLLDSGSDDMSLWAVSGDGEYEFVNKKNTANSVNANLRYNSGYGFACYGTGTGSALTLYKKDTRTYLTAPASVSATLNPSDNTIIDVTFSSVANAGTYTIVATPSIGDQVVKAGVASNPASISVADGLAYATEYTISVYAVPADPTSYKNSAATEAASTVTTGSRPAPSAGTMIWQEDFTGWSSWTDYASGVSHVYGGGAVDYSTSTNCTYQDDNLAGGAKPEILITKSSDGKFIVKDIPISGATSVTLFYNTNHDYCSLSASSGTPSAKSYSTYSDKVKVWEITSITADTEFLDITLTNTNSSNCRADNFVIKAGTKLFQSLSFASPSLSWIIGTDCTLSTPKAGQIVSGANTTIIYTSSDPSVATVNSSGVVTPLKAGSTTITATAAENGSYWDASTSYSLEIAAAGGTKVSFVVGTDFTNLTQVNTGVQKDGITVSSNTTAYYNPLRIYSGNTISVSAVSGKRIVKVVLTGSTDGYIKTWSASDSGSCSISGSTMTWESGGVSSIVFTQTASAQARLTTIDVTYTE